jgi:outer membrane protein TolC
MNILKSKNQTAGTQTPSFKMRLLPALIGVVVLGGCASTTPEPLTIDEVKATSAEQIKSFRSEVEPLTQSLTLEESVARGIKYNLERRTKMMEEAYAYGHYDVTNFDMLPKLIASAGYRSRDSDLITRSRDSVTGAPSLANPYISSDRSGTTHDLALTWNLLDFGQGYLVSKQSGDKAQIMGERRRKALHLLIQDIRTAFWRAASAQKLKKEVVATIAEAESALDEARIAEAERLRNPLDSLRYQRQLLENLRLLEAVDQELTTGKIELASLIGSPPDTDLKLIEPNEDQILRWLDVPVERMENHAIAQNADVRESFLSARLAAAEAKRGLLRLYPNLSFSYAVRSSSDSYLINSNWNDAGAQLSFNLLGLLAYSDQKKYGEAGIALAEQQRQTTLMSVITQVHLGRLQLANAYRQFSRAEGIAVVDTNIAEQIAKREQAQTQTKLDRVANNTSAILSQLRKYQAMAQVHAAASKLQATLGLEPVIQGSQAMPVKDLTQAVGAALRKWEQGEMFAGVPMTKPKAVVQKPAPVVAAAVAAAAPAPAAAPALNAGKQGVKEALDSWVAAWSSKNVDAYLGAYAPSFKSARGAARGAWEADRKRVFAQTKDIKLGLADVKIDYKDNLNATATFVQNYQSNLYKDAVNKTLVLQRIGGRWLIVSENTSNADKR